MTFFRIYSAEPWVARRGHAKKIRQKPSWSGAHLSHQKISWISILSKQLLDVCSHFRLFDGSQIKAAIQCTNLCMLGDMIGLIKINRLLSALRLFSF